MAGSLVLIEETTVTSAVSAVTLTGITSDFNVYKVIANNVQIDTDSQPVKKRFTVSGSAVTSSSYDMAFKRLRTENTFQNKGATEQDSFGNLDSIGTATNEQLNEEIYIFNASNSSEYTFATHDAVMTIHDSSHCHGIAGGVCLTENSVVDGITFFAGSGNIDAGRFVLYGIAK